MTIFMKIKRHPEQNAVMTDIPVLASIMLDI